MLFRYIFGRSGGDILLSPCRLLQVYLSSEVAYYSDPQVEDIFVFTVTSQGIYYFFVSCAEKDICCPSAIISLLAYSLIIVATFDWVGYYVL